jgi:hypothetical protein
MEQLELLEAELKMMQENISRLRIYVSQNSKEKWTPCQSRVVGELKHRAVALKQRLTLISRIATYQFFR